MAVSFAVRRWSIRLAIPLVGLAATLYYLSWELRATGGVLGLPLDDSWIHLCFARSLAAGRGMAYGESGLVSGSTGPLWTALLSLAFSFGIAPLVWAKLLGVLAYLAAAPLVFRLTRELGAGALAGAAAVAFYLVTDWMPWSALSGMEVSLFVALSLAGLWLQALEARRAWRSAWALPVLALSALARPEGVLLLALAAAERVVVLESKPEESLRAGFRWPPSLGPALLAAGLIAASFGLFSWAVSGSAAPSTLAAKTSGVVKWLPAVRDFLRAFEILFRPLPWLAFLAAAGAVRILVRRLEQPRTSVATVLWIVALPAAYSLLAAPGEPMPVGNFGRYLFPLLPVVVVLGAAGLSPLLERLVVARDRGDTLARTALVVVVLTVLAAPTLSAFFTGARRYALNVANVQASDVAAGRWIAANLPADEVLAVQDIGAIGYLTPNPLVDMVGIVDPPVARIIRERGFAGLRDLLLARDVRYLVLFPSSYGGLEALAGALPDFEIERRFTVPQNITMAGDELLVLRLEPRAKGAQRP